MWEGYSYLVSYNYSLVMHIVWYVGGRGVGDREAREAMASQQLRSYSQLKAIVAAQLSYSLL